jgi:hypothetical protein
MPAENEILYGCFQGPGCVPVELRPGFGKIIQFFEFTLGRVDVAFIEIALDLGIPFFRPPGGS